MGVSLHEIPHEDLEPQIAPVIVLGEDLKGSPGKLIERRVPSSSSLCSHGDSEASHGSGKDKPMKWNRAQTVLFRATVLAFLFMVLEVVGGFISQSVAIKADAAHMFSDVSGYIIALAAAYLANRGANKRFPYGYKRVEILGALMSVLLIWIVTGWLVVEAVQRLLEPEEVNHKVMVTTAALGIVFNLCIFWTLGGQHHHHHGMPCTGHHHHHHGGGGACGHAHGRPLERLHRAAAPSCCGHGEKDPEQALCGEGCHAADREDEPLRGPGDQHGSCGSRHHNHQHGHGAACGGRCGGSAAGVENLNVRGALLHALGDLLQSVGVLAAGIIMWLAPSCWWADSATTLVFSLVVFWTTRRLICDIFAILMQRAPAAICADSLEEEILSVAGVSAVDKLSVWSLSSEHHVMSAHLRVCEHASSVRAAIRAVEVICRRHGISDTTIQVEPLA
uniref:Solute carrier family 30 (Zinc transporter), member 1 n=1 Tax=Tetraselmis sp. GSL018 TaxID=582737 RepID=A0A061SH73_9CHLO